ncbi:MAG: hypothetical protein COA79_13745 [Planctomycetota bacterium]|nr:MAG: hypothetical protein COA79_13745 [Planctomycetota bacterium]
MNKKSLDLANLKIIFAFIIAVLLVNPVAVYSADKNEKAIKEIDQQIEKGVKYLMTRANKDGSIGNPKQPNPGITGLIVAAVAKTSLKGKYKKDLISAADFILKTKNPKDHSYGKNFIQFSNYFTSVALLAFTSLDKEKYKEEIKNTQNYLKGAQFSKENGNYKKGDWQYGGFDYNKEGKADPDLNNTGFALMALKASDLKKDDKAWKNAVVFLQRVQNSPEVSDLDKSIKGTKVLNDGGAMYYPGNTKGKEIKNSDGTTSYPSYGSMTYTLMQSYLFAGIPKDDIRVKETMRYVKNNFSLVTNPGLPAKQAKQGLYNYYRIMAEALNTLGETKIETNKGRRIIWAKELGEHLGKLQLPNGSWVNKESERWLEGDPDLVTAYALFALVACKSNLSAKN